MIAAKTAAAVQMTSAPMQGTSVSEAAIGGAVAAYLRQHHALVVQVCCASTTECGAALLIVSAEIEARRLVLLAPESLTLPDGFSHLATVRIASEPMHAFGAADLAAALDRLPHLDGTLVVLLMPAETAALSASLAPVAPSPGKHLAFWLAARLREAACSGGGAG